MTEDDRPDPRLDEDEDWGAPLEPEGAGGSESSDTSDESYEADSAESGTADEPYDSGPGDAGDDGYDLPEVTRRRAAAGIGAVILGALGVDSLSDGDVDGNMRSSVPAADDTEPTTTAQPADTTSEPTETTTSEPTETTTETTTTQPPQARRALYTDFNAAETLDHEPDIPGITPGDPDYEGKDQYVAAFNVNDIAEFWGEDDLEGLKGLEAGTERWLALDIDRSGGEYTLGWKGVNGTEKYADASDVMAFAEEYEPEEVYVGEPDGDTSKSVRSYVSEISRGI